MLAAVAFGGAEQTDAGLVTANRIGELRGVVVAGLLAMGDQVLEQQLFLFQIEDPQPSLAGGQREINHRQTLGSARTIVDGALHGRDGVGQNLAIERGRQSSQAVGHRLIGCTGRPDRRSENEKSRRQAGTSKHGHHRASNLVGPGLTTSCLAGAAYSLPNTAAAQRSRAGRTCAQCPAGYVFMGPKECRQTPERRPYRRAV